MKAQLPEPSQVLSAVETYISIAYDGSPPTAVRSQIASLRAWAGPFFAAPVFAATGDPATPRRTMRLGNSGYPHMKLALEPSPDGAQYLFKADTHDRHICPASSDADYAAFTKLMQANQQIAERIESAWAKQGIPTFKTFLKDDLARRQQAQGKLSS